MQSIFRLPWSSDQFGLGAADKVRFGKDVAPTRSEAPVNKQIKRKRAHSSESENAPRTDVKRIRPATASSANYVPSFTALQTTDQQSKTTTSVVTVNEAQPSADIRTKPVLPKMDTSTPSILAGEVKEEDVQMDDAHLDTDVASQRQAKLCQAIENQINLQILLKHNEMRLIDQELAKCQIALEQLRRCELHPYPGQSGFDYNVSTGSGPSVQPAQGMTVPTHAPPHGVADGPYTRHYRQWLLPDPQFDSESIHTAALMSAQLAGARGGRVGRKALASGSYSSPQRHDFPGLPSVVPPVPRKDTNLPLVLRRSTDGKMVKLVCNNCNRGNMSSIQGFLNHCRIAHKVVYESHDAAAKDCGRVLDDQELASLPTEAQSAPAPKPAVRHAPSRTQSVVVPPPAVPGSVHPFNAPHAKVRASKPTSKTSKAVSASTSAQPAQHATSPFNPAAALPRLSALFVRKKAGGDLEQAAVDAQTKSDLFLDDAMSPASLTPGSPAVATPISGRGGLSAAGNAHRIHGGKGRSQMAQHSYFAPPQAGSEQHDNADSPREMNLSPHAVDSNPGLVSDLEDDDNGSASEEESSAPHHPLSHPLGINTSCGGENMDIAVAEDDGVVHHGSVVIRRNSTLSADDRGLHVVGTSSSKLGGN